MTKVTGSAPTARRARSANTGVPPGRRNGGSPSSVMVSAAAAPITPILITPAPARPVASSRPPARTRRRSARHVPPYISSVRASARDPRAASALVGVTTSRTASPSRATTIRTSLVPRTGGRHRGLPGQLVERQVALGVAVPGAVGRGQRRRRGVLLAHAVGQRLQRRSSPRCSSTTGCSRPVVLRRSSETIAACCSSRWSISSASRSSPSSSARRAASAISRMAAITCSGPSWSRWAIASRSSSSIPIM